jgi:hypothetical protein
MKKYSASLISYMQESALCEYLPTVPRKGTDHGLHSCMPTGCGKTRAVIELISQHWGPISMLPMTIGIIRYADTSLYRP